MNDTNKLIFKRSDYRNNEEFYSALFQQFKILIESNNIFSFHENPDLKGVYAIQYGPSHIDVDDSYPVWLNSAELIYVTAFAKNMEYQKAKDFIEEYEKHQPDDDDWSIDDFKTSKKKKPSGGNHDA